ncbi:hypothetical protein Taro_054481 [Colocasia esculenta]|uniref:Uncharacterized protein n=1 Tax=Colocasia esculenta TaxID=4460 RepID=A0A843XQT2_COLES|nr:hypothetical protein [Colocasia esculenta]
MSALQVTKRQVRQSLFHCHLSLSRTYNLNTGVRVSRSDDTDLDGTTQVPGQSPELTAWLIENLGHPTREVAQVGVNKAVANQTAKIRRPYPMSPSSYSKRQHIWTPTSQRPYLAVNP